MDIEVFLFIFDNINICKNDNDAKAACLFST